MEQLPKEEAQIRRFYEMIQHSKALQIDLREFDRNDEGDERRTLKFREKSVERINSRKNLEGAKATRIAPDTRSGS